MSLQISAWLRLPKRPMCYILILISSKFVKKENRGAKGNAVAKNETKPSWIIASL